MVSKDSMMHLGALNGGAFPPSNVFLMKFHIYFLRMQSLCANIILIELCFHNFCSHCCQSSNLPAGAIYLHILPIIDSSPHIGLDLSRIRKEAVVGRWAAEVQQIFSLGIDERNLA